VLPHFPSLHPFEFSVFSQNGEDGIINKLVSLLPVVNRPQTFVEIGWHPDENNTGFLAYEYDWVGRTFDMEHGDGGHPWGYAVKTRVTTENVADLVREVSVQPDLISIDVDGQDYWLMEAILEAGINPMLFVVEYNAAFGPDQKVTVPNRPDWEWDGTDYFGASLGALFSLAKTYGYTLVGTDSKGVNAFFVPRLFYRHPKPDAEVVRDLFTPIGYPPHSHSPKVETEVVRV